MKRTERVVGAVAFSAVVRVTDKETTVPFSTPKASEEARAQIGLALRVYGPFAISSSLKFNPGAIVVDVIDRSRNQDVVFDRQAFETFVQRAHQICGKTLREHTWDNDVLEREAETFASQERRSPESIRKFFASITGNTAAALVTNDGAVIDIGIIKKPPREDHANLEIDVARVEKLVRVKTNTGEFNIDAKLAADLHVGDHVNFRNVELVAEQNIIRADGAELVDEGSHFSEGDLFTGESIGNKDDP